MDLLIQNIAVWGVMSGAAAYLGFYVYRQFSSKSGCAACQLKKAAVLKKNKPVISRQVKT
ncbi:MAG: hypothetical protein IID63_06750 [candidate division Zixibacteria bacterium]|nr:hypothetical protein [candidate division Zixibacteria bacterium]